MSFESKPLGLPVPARGAVAIPLGLAVLALLAVASVAWGVHRGLAPDGSRDLQWSGIHVLWLGLDPSRTFLACRHAACADYFILSQYPNYPISALMSLLPLGALPWAIAKPAWLVVTLAATGILYWCARTDLAKHLDTRLLACGFLLLLISTPYRNVLSNGQETVFVMAAFAVALRQARRGQPFVAGLCLALSWSKFTLTFPLSLVFVARRDWRVVAVATAAHIVLTLAAAAWTGTDPIAATFGFLDVAKLAIDYRFGFLDVNSIAAHLAVPSAFATVAAVAFAATGLVLAWRLRGRDESLLLAVTSLMAMAAFYHFSYDCVIFLFPLLYGLQTVARGTPRGADRVFVPLVLATIAVTWFLNRVVEGNNAGYSFGGGNYIPFYWAMIASFYAAIAVGIYRLWIASLTPIPPRPAD